MISCWFGKLVRYACLFSLLAVYLPAQAEWINWPSFDCNNARTSVENLICAHKKLGLSDQKMANEYRNYLLVRNDKAHIRAEQRRWLKDVRDTCKNVTCLNHVYAARIQALQVKVKYRFTLMHGDDPVCHAYLQRLNTTNFKTAPYNGIPENSHIPGFVYLHRVPVKMSDLNGLYPVIRDFVIGANDKAFDWTNLKWQDQIKMPLLGSEKERILNDINEGKRAIWRYVPRIDINNDGDPDDVEVWSNIFTTNLSIQCITVADYSQTQCNPPRHSQFAFVFIDHYRYLDVEKTKNIFGSPAGGYPVSAKHGGGVLDAFRPVGTTIGIFEYRNVYYFDTFFDHHGNFHGKRKNDPKMPWTLGVFKNQGGKTRQLCSYFMSAY